MQEKDLLQNKQFNNAIQQLRDVLNKRWFDLEFNGKEWEFGFKIIIK